jgi:tetratricopeptide (TPR) repeat protein
MLALSLPAMAAPDKSRISAAGLAIKYNNAGVDLFSAGRYLDAISEYSRAIVANPRYAEAYSNRGAAYDALNDSQKAVHDYSMAIHLDPSLTAAYSNRAAALGDLARFSDALADWQVVMKRHPRSESAFLGRGFCYKGLGDLKLAMSDFNEAVKINPHDAKAVAALESVKKLLGSATVVSHLVPTQPASPAKPERPTQPAITPAAVTPVQPASSLAPAAPAVKPDQAGGNGGSGFRPSLKQPEPPVGAACVPPAQTTSPPALTPSYAIGNSAVPPSPWAVCLDAVHQFMGGVYVAVGQYRAAAAQYNQAVLDNPRDAFAHFRCANVLSLQGDDNAALKEYEAAVEHGPHFRQAYIRREQLKQRIAPSGSGDAASNHTP